MLGIILKDVHHSARSLTKQPAFTSLVVLTLALGIGANTAVFSVVNAVMLRALPYPDADRLVSVWETVGEDKQTPVATSYPTYVDWREQSQSFETMGVSTTFGTVILSGGEEALRLRANFVSPEYLDLLGARPEVGRLVQEGDNLVPDGHPIAVLSHGLWQRRFGGDPNVVGQSISLDRQNYMVVGVMDSDFHDIPSAQFNVDIWIPVMMASHIFPPDVLENRIIRGFVVLAKLRPGRGLEAVEQELDGIARNLAAAYPESNNRFGATATPLRTQLLGNLDDPLTALMVGAGFLLIVACTNVASLMLVRSATRRRELAVRSALGASVARQVQHLTTEAIVLGLLGGAVGVVMAFWFLDLLMGISTVQLPGFIEINLDSSVLLFSFVTALAAGVAFGLLPALRSARADVRGELSGTGQRSGGDLAGKTARNLLVVFEVATAMILLVGSGLLVRSFQELRNAEMGFRTDNLLTLQITLPTQRYQERSAVFGFLRELVERVEARPGVEFASIWGPGIPGQAGWHTTVIPEGKVVQSQLDADLARFHQVSPGAIEKMGIRTLAGRTISEADRTDALPVAVVSESLARTLWPDRDAIGMRIRHFIPPGADEETYPWFTVVGVVADANHGGRIQFGGLATSHDMYFSHSQRFRRIRPVALLVGTRMDPGEVASTVRAVIQDLDAELPIFNLRTMREVVHQEERLSQFTASLMGTFGSLSLFLAALGIYGLLSQSVTLRSREIALRFALGSQPATTVKLFVSQGMRLVLVGVGIGLVGAIGLTRFVSSLLFGVGHIDPTTLAATTVVLLLVALIACYLPTRRALRVDPVVTLRAEQ